MTTHPIVLIVNPFAELIASRLSERFKNLEIIRMTSESEPEADVSGVDVVTSWYLLRDILPRIRHLKWFQAMITGYEFILGTGLIRGPTRFTHAAGVATVPVAEMAIAYMLGLVKGFPEAFRSKQNRIFPGAPGEKEEVKASDELYGKTVGILGVGNIGKRLALLAKAFETKVLGYDKFVREASGFDRIYAEEGLDEILSVCDFLVITLPLTDETWNLIGERELRLMKKSAFLINVARGDVVDKQALLKALKEHWIAGGATDVFWGNNPVEWYLEREDGLWEVPDLILTPHNAAWTPNYIPRFCELFCENIRRFLAGEPLLNTVSLDR